MQFSVPLLTQVGGAIFNSNDPNIGPQNVLDPEAEAPVLLSSSSPVSFEGTLLPGQYADVECEPSLLARY